MPVFEYEAFDGKGRKRKGILDAESLAAVKGKLREKGHYPIEVRETTEKEAPGGKVYFGRFRLRGASHRDVSAMTRELATLLGAGLPLVPALSSLLDQTANPRLRKILAEIREQINEGESFAGSLAGYPRVFSPFYVNMVQAGETSGTLHLVLERVADYTEMQQALRGKITASLAYPFFMFFVGALVLFFLTTVIIPKITSIFEEVNQDLPLITEILLGVSETVRSYWWAMALVATFLFIAVRLGVRRSEKWAFFMDRLKLKAPLAGTVFHKVLLARFAHTLGTLLQSGVPLLTALEISRRVVHNRPMASVIERAGAELAEGRTLADTLSGSDLFPPFVIQMISVGEQSGALENMLLKVSRSYEEEAASRLVVLTSLLEPVMILVMGLLVAFIVVSILLPIFEMNQLIR